MTKKTENIVDIIFSLILIAGIIWICVDYKHFIEIDIKPSGRAGKAFVILMHYFDSNFGKIVTQILIVILPLPYIIKTFKRNFLSITKREEK